MAVGGVRGELAGLGFGFRRFWKEWSEAEMDWERECGREEERSEEGLMP